MQGTSEDSGTDHGRLDVLTGLPDREAFRIEVERAVTACGGPGRSAFGLLQVDLHRFETINHLYGLAHGDAVLREVSLRLRELLRPDDVLARVGGDQFAILQLNPHERLLAREVVEALATPMDIADCRLSLASSVGMAFYPGDGLDAEALLRNAALALRAARGDGGGAYRFYIAGMDRAARMSFAIEHDMLHALEEGQFLLHYQPQIDLRSGEPVACEALLRWRHPEHGLLMPGRIIPVAERKGYIGALGDWVLQHACRQLADWQRTGRGPNRMAVNVSALQLRDPSLPRRLAGLLSSMDLDPGSLQLEVTESVAFRDPQRAIQTLNEIRNLGVSLAVDDFGSGYSSLNALQFIPANMLKLDRTLTGTLVGQGRQAAIGRAAVELGHNLGMQVLAEGVETVAQRTILASLGCDMAQGYLFARPMTAMQLSAFLHREQGDGPRPTDRSGFTVREARAGGVY